MSDVAIRVENLGKRYVIGGKQERYSTLRDTLVEMTAAPFRRMRGVLRGESAAGLKEEIWALRDVSFEVKHGEVVGIIGRNGAGKSTLLKVLSRITEPTTGYADVYGRIGALLEVGTGFHPELTGRENIYLNGAILGMSREEINRKFDEIVDFAGVEKFIDTPVKHYSSGMGLRLGFAVAAHLEPEILIVDEVLAVGDAEFQKKCMGKMSEVAGEGRTVLFVSHNMSAVGQLCPRALLLDAGSVSLDGATEKVLEPYLTSSKRTSNLATSSGESNREGVGDAKIVEILLLDERMSPASTLQAGRPATFMISYKSNALEPVGDVAANLRIEDSRGQFLFTASNSFTATGFGPLPETGFLVCKLSTVPLVEGEYCVYVSLYRRSVRLDAIDNALWFSVVSSNTLGPGKFPTARKHGPFLVQQHWEYRPLTSSAPRNIDQRTSDTLTDQNGW